MRPEDICDDTRLSLSIAHDEGRPPDEQTARHVADCAECTAFEQSLSELDGLLAAGRFDKSPEIATPVIERLRSRPRTQWWAVAAVAFIGIAIGALVGGVGTRLDTVQARDLDELFHEASSSLAGFTADLVVVERGWHPEVPERVYTGNVAYTAPESLNLELIDTTAYPSQDWVENDVSITIANGDFLSTASSKCPLAALPECQEPPSLIAISERIPFEESPVSPLDFTGESSGSMSWSGIDVVGLTVLEGRDTIQVATTVAGVEMISGLTQLGAWREFHPTDRVLLWLDEETLVPIRVEVTAAGSPERALWQVRRGYEDNPGGDPILIVELVDFSAHVPSVDVDLPGSVRSAGFIETSVDVPHPTLPPGFTEHRSGRWTLPDGGSVDAATWSNGRAWVMVEMTSSWTEPRLFGLSTPFARAVDLGEGSVGQLDPLSGSVAIHARGVDVLVSGSLPESELIDAASTLGVDGLPLPPEWEQASMTDVDDLPRGTLVPNVDGWDLLAKAAGDQTSLLLVGTGNRAVIIDQEPGTRLDPPMGADSVAVDVRDRTGRYEPGSGTLEWIEEGVVIRIRSDSVGSDELMLIAESLAGR